MAAHAAIQHVTSGMRLGLGTGSTAAHFVNALGARVKEGLDVVCVPTSTATFKQAQSLNIKLATLNEYPELDLTVDGTDEIDADMTLIKGGGGALLREKIVAFASKRVLIISDESKDVKTLGAFPLPVEIVPFGLEATKRAIAQAIEQAGCNGSIALRQNAEKSIFISDNGNYIFDLALQSIPDSEKIAYALSQIPGVVEHGLFMKLATGAIIATQKGIVERGVV